MKLKYRILCLMIITRKTLRVCIVATILLLIVSACGQDEDTAPANTPVATAVADTSQNDTPTAAAISSGNNGGQTDEAAATPEPTVSNTPEPTATFTPTPTPKPPKAITICMAQEPISLYLYGDTSLAATAVRHALYENLYTNLSYEYQPQGLEKLPNLADGDAVINTVTVERNDLVATPGGNVTELITGVIIVNSDGELVSFDGETPITVSQMSVQFRFKPMAWADGTLVTAADSVYSFQLDADPITPGSKFKIERTESYTAVDDLTVRWVGIPGYLDPDYFTNVWQPLPRHQLDGFQAIELTTAEETTHMPLGNGPYSVAEWDIGDHIILQANPHYYRASEGLPNIDTVRIRFHPDMTGERPSDCDIITQDAVSLEQTVSWETSADIVAHYANSGVFEHIALGIDSYDDYGDGYDKGRPDWFEDTRVRQALAHCINRQHMVAELTFGKSEEMHAYIPDDHPLFPADATIWPYDREGARSGSAGRGRGGRCDSPFPQQARSRAGRVPAADGVPAG
jgi:peptide/nickel transport system substrate-binding protein